MILFEPHEGFYYIVRNSTVLLREGRLSLNEWRHQIKHFLWILVVAEGLRAALTSLLSGLRDGLSYRLGKRLRPML